MMRDQKGITLVALIITIIVMLILVAVTISVAMNGGLFSNAKEARDKTIAETAKEAVTLAKAELLSNYYLGQYTAGAPDAEDDVQPMIESYLYKTQYRVEVSSSEDWLYSVTVTPINGTITMDPLTIDMRAVTSGN